MFYLKYLEFFQRREKAIREMMSRVSFCKKSFLVFFLSLQCSPERKGDNNDPNGYKSSTKWLLGKNPSVIDKRGSLGESIELVFHLWSLSLIQGGSYISCCRQVVLDAVGVSIEFLIRVHSETRWRLGLLTINTHMRLYISLNEWSAGRENGDLLSSQAESWRKGVDDDSWYG